MTRRWIAAFATAMMAAATCAGSAGAADGLGLTEARSAKFPDRAYVLSLPEVQTLKQAAVSVTENGQPVDGLQVSNLGAKSAVVLAIDASASMGEKIHDAMAAARAFADHRRQDQRLGIVFFSSEPVVALEPTTDSAAIDRALAEAPKLPRGTRVYDAAATGVELVKRAGVAAGSVIILSDGADYQSGITRNELVDEAELAHVRFFGVGLRSPHFDPVSLQTLTATGGSYVEAARPEDLTGIYGRLALRQGREFLVTYRSRQPLETAVAVAVAVSGIDDIVTAAYRAPEFPVPPALPDPPPTWWESGTATTTVVLIIGLLIAVGLWMPLRPIRVSMSRRISRFTGGSVTSADELATQKARDFIAAADGRLSRWHPWVEFELDVELSKLTWPPLRIAAVVVLATILVALGLFVTGSPALGVLAIPGVPITARLVIRYLATKTRRAFEEQLPDNLQVMASALRAGHSFVAALSVMVRDAPEPSKKEFRRVVRDEELGIPIESTLDIVHERMRCDDLVYVGLIATLQRETGGNTAEVLDKVVETMRERGKLRRLVRTLTAQGRLGGWIVTALPIAMIVFLNLFKPDYLNPMLDKTIGWAILILAALMVALGAYCIRRIVDIKV